MPRYPQAFLVAFLFPWDEQFGHIDDLLRE